MRPEPIHALEKEKASSLIGKQILFANEERGLGTYGVLVGWSTRGFFIVEPDYDPIKLIHCTWIVEYKYKKKN